MSLIIWLLIIVLFISLEIFKRKYPKKKLAALLGTATMVLAIIINALVSHSGSRINKYIIIIFGAYTFIGLVGDIVDLKKKQIKS